MSVLVNQDVRRTLFGMAFPLLAGTFSMSAYTLVDTWFVSRLGTLPLAAMGFTFPVIMLLTCVAGGLGTGVTTLVSHAIGRHDAAGAARITTHGILLIIGVAVLIALAGYLTIAPVFKRMGADAETLPFIGQFMGIWYLGAVFMSLPMMGNGLLISVGDFKTASRFMILGTAVNAVLNPILIFGLLGLPALGIRGSALATVLAQAVSTSWLFLLLYKKHRLLIFAAYPVREVLASYRKIIGIGFPSILSMILMPVSAGVITTLIARFGSEAVAATGAAGRLEMVAFVIPMALGISLTPFISQNYGANRMDRIREAFAVSSRFALAYGAAVAVLFFCCAPWLANLFSQDPKVVEILVAYIRIIAFGYGMMEVHRYTGFVLTGMHKAAFATVINAIRVLVLLIPLSYLGLYWGGIHGIFIGRLATDLLAGSLGLVWIRHLCADRGLAAGGPESGSG